MVDCLVGRKKQYKDRAVSPIKLVSYASTRLYSAKQYGIPSSVSVAPLLYISDSEHCEFVDISNGNNWNPKTSMETSSFLYSMGFVRPLSVKRPVYNLVRAIYFAEA